MVTKTIDVKRDIRAEQLAAADAFRKRMTGRAVARGALRDMEQYMAAHSATQAGLPSDGRQPH